jgi:high-affinity iron transporter
MGAALSALIFRGLLVIPPRRIFQVTTCLITLLAAGMAAQSVAQLEQAGLITALSQTAWDLSSALPDSSALGVLLKALVGYSDRPSLMMVLVFASALLATLAATRLAQPAQTPVRAR